MIKAFLSHSSADKEFVRAVARNLGRQFCLFDEQVFDNADTFKKSIEEKLAASSIFILFASADSIRRAWVEFEIEEAWYLILQKKISKSLVVMIDSSIDHTAIPNWLARAKVLRSNSASLVSREIRQHIDEIIRTEQHPFFEGRTAELDDLQQILTPIGEPPPHVIGISGLPNIGRKTFINKSAQLNLGFNRTIKIFVEEGDRLEELAIKVASLIEPYSTQAGFEHIIKTIRAESEDLQLTRIINNLKIAVANKELPIFIDEGGMFTADGQFSHACSRTIYAAQQSEEIYLFTVSSRKPPSVLPFLSLKPLGAEHIKRLISKIGTKKNLILNAAQISELAAYVNGYPPAAYYAVDLAKNYGIDLVLADKNRLVQFRSSVFIKYLKEKQLSENQKTVLLILARYSPLPLKVLADGIGITAAMIASEIVGLIDHSLILPAETGLYSIADPVSDSVVAEFRTGQDIDHEKIYRSLRQILDDTDFELPRLDLNRLLFKAAFRGGVSADKLFHMTNDLINLLTDFYHRREYKKCIDAARIAIDEAPDSITAWDYLIRALIQEENWQFALVELKNFEKYGAQRDIDFLYGFLERKRGDYQRALSYFLSAERSGRSGFALSREIANCYFLKDDIPSAKKYIQEALAKKDNNYVIDLSIQIANREGDEAAARAGLAKLEALDAPSFVQHRLSTIELRFGDPKKALAASRAAVSHDSRGTFSVFAQLATCLIRVGDFGEAEKVLHRLGSAFGNQKTEVRLGLSCRLEIEKRQYSKALKTMANIGNSHLPVYRAMRRDAIAGELANSVMDDAKRIAMSEELEQLNSDLNSFDPTDAWLKFIK
jgi:tetratricopeptide (TPR) repeat protein